MTRFAVTDLSNFYLDVAKDRLYVRGPSSPDRRRAAGPCSRIDFRVVSLHRFLHWTCCSAGRQRCEPARGAYSFEKLLKQPFLCQNTASGRIAI